MAPDSVAGQPPPRLALVGPSWPWRGGIAVTTTALGAALQRRGALAGALIPARQYPGWLFPGRDDRDPEACQRLDEADACFGVLEPWTWTRLLVRLRRLHPEALVIPYWTWVWAPVLLALLTQTRLPAVAVVHNPADHGAGPLSRLAARLVLGRCAGFLVHARSVAAGLRRDFPQTPARVHPLPAVAPPAAHRSAARARLGLAEETTAVLCFGLIRPYKGVDVVLEAMARLPEAAPITLLLVGEPWGGERGRLSRLLADPRLAGKVIARLEWVPEREAGEWFAAADAAVLPYRSATGSAVAAQCLGAGLPVVASHVGGLADVVRDGVNGLLVSPGDPAALAAALLRVVDQTVRGALARGTVDTGTWDSYAEEVLGLVGSIRRQRERPPGARS